MMIFKRISSSIWMNYTHKLMQEMLVMAIRKKWLMMICFMVLSESIVYPQDKVYSDKSLYNEALEEAERRKSENMKKII